LHSKKTGPHPTVKKAILYSRQKIKIHAEITPMKKYILLNLTGLFVFFLFTCMFISCGKSGKSNPESEESSKPPTTSVGPKATKFTPQMVVAAFEKAGDRMPPDAKAKMMEGVPLKDPAKMAEAAEEINAKLASGEVKLKEISVDALADFLVQSMKPPSASARAKGARIKCVNNLGSISKAMIGFSQDNNGRLPWQLTPVQVRNHLDASVVANSNFGRAAGVDNLMFMHQKVFSVGGVFGMAAVKAELQTPKILISPCDPGRKVANETIFAGGGNGVNWNNYSTKRNKPLPHAGISYGLCFGADTQRPTTILGTTRNLSADELAKSIWVGAEDAKRGMAGLQMGQGQMVMMDGSARQSSKDDIGEAGRMIKAHINSRGGQARGNASTRMALPY
jgi:hypothetical protein